MNESYAPGPATNERLLLVTSVLQNQIQLNLWGSKARHPVLVNKTTYTAPAFRILMYSSLPFSLIRSLSIRLSPTNEDCPLLCSALLSPPLSASGLRALHSLQNPLICQRHILVEPPPAIAQRG